MEFEIIGKYFPELTTDTTYCQNNFRKLDDSKKHKIRRPGASYSQIKKQNKNGIGNNET